MLLFKLEVLIFHFVVCLSGCETWLVQLAVLPVLTAFMADSSEDSERSLWDQCPLLLCLPKEAVVLQCFPLPGDRDVPGSPPSCVASKPKQRSVCKVWPRGAHWAGKTQYEQNHRLHSQQISIWLYTSVRLRDILESTVNLHSQPRECLLKEW